MAARDVRRTVRSMSHLARTAELMRLAPHVYGAALAASRDELSAAGVTERVLAQAASQPVISRDRLVEHAILTAVRQAPAICFEGMQRPDREAVALARLAGYSTDQVASCLGIGTGEAKASMLGALAGAAIQAAS
jgi:DNA-directed RNA polymerase specialized sigma24 family protein